MLDTSLELVDLDFETYWGTKYTLKQLSLTDYVHDPRFDVHGFGVARQSEGFKPRFIRRPQAREYLASLPWHRICLAAHHMNFDGLVLGHHYQHFPARYFCTQAASRWWHKSETRHGLDNLAAFHQLAGKTDGLKATKDKRYADLTESDLEALEAYTIRDLKLGLYFALFFQRKLPLDEQLLIDLTTRMFTMPLCEVDLELAHEALEEIKASKLTKLTNYDLKTLRSAKKFAALLSSMGVDPPQKISPRTGKVTYAFAKKDESFLELLLHPREEVRDVIEAKMEASSNIDVTRAERLIKLGNTGSLPICLNFAGAHTDRWSGGNKMNIQNFRAGSKLRRAIRARLEHVLVAVDASQIEARFNAWFCDQFDLLELFRRNEDPYNDLGAFIYHRPIDRTINKLEGFVAKTAFLGLGYNMGAPKFQATLATGRTRVVMALTECQLVVSGYRAKNDRIASMWPLCHEWLKFLANGKGTLTYKCLTIDADAKRIWFPNGSSLYYPGISYEGGEITYLTADGSARYIYGGKLLENIIQKLARDFIGMVMLRIKHAIVWMTHDEIVAHVHHSLAQQALQEIIFEMSTPPWWAPDVPLAAKGGYDTCYSK